jgi:hypothetical protein
MMYLPTEKQMMYESLRPPLPDAKPVPHDVYILLRYRIFSLLVSHTRYSLPSSSPHRLTLARSIL